MYSVILPIYGNEGSLPELLEQLSLISLECRAKYKQDFEAVFVIDGSPDNSYQVLKDTLDKQPFNSQLLCHSRNFGSFAAIRTGLSAAKGDFFSVIAADLQEPPSLLLSFLDDMLNKGSDVVVGCREKRDDPYLSRIASGLFWRFYKRFVIPDIPVNGVDIFGCNLAFRDSLISLEEANSSLVGQLFWLGYKRSEVAYSRAERKHGQSGWTFKKKINYLLDSVFSFTDSPIRLLTIFGVLGIGFSILFGLLVLLAKVFGFIDVPGYAGVVLTVVLFGGINSLGLGIVGYYAWRSYENTKKRPLSVVMASHSYGECQKLDKERV